MKCFICDNQLKDKEIVWNADHEDWEPCVKCLNIINDVFHDHVDEQELRLIIEKDVAELFYEQNSFNRGERKEAND